MSTKDSNMNHLVKNTSPIQPSNIKRKQYKKSNIALFKSYDEHSIVPSIVISNNLFGQNIYTHFFVDEKYLHIEQFKKTNTHDFYAPVFL